MENSDFTDNLHKELHRRQHSKTCIFHIYSVSSYFHCTAIIPLTHMFFHVSVEYGEDGWKEYFFKLLLWEFYFFLNTLAHPASESISMFQDLHHNGRCIQPKLSITKTYKDNNNNKSNYIINNSKRNYTRKNGDETRH